MRKSDFAFIKDTTLRENIENVFVDVASLITMATQADQGVKNCLRKTIIIYTASITEALLFWKIQKEFGTEKIPLPDEWKQQILYTLPPQNGNEEYKITLTKQIREKKDADKLDFNRMINLCKHKKILKDDLLKDLDKVRNLRNNLHIGGLKTITKTYPQKDVDFTLKALEKFRQSIQ